ncbi:MAG: protein kinase [Chloroflexi bacterium]|nr:protein kinase [Chloroflexota bacterium]
MIGDTLSNRYRLQNRVKRDQFADLYLARDLRVNAEVAVAVTVQQLGEDPDMVRSFISDAQLAEGLNDSHIVRVLDAGEDNGRFYLVMESVPGSTLDQVLNNRGALPINEAVDLADQALQALQVAHAARVLHRDIKPPNLLLTRSGTLKVMKFGMATIADAFGGTAQYISPEQAVGKKIDHRSDVYALGVTLFELLAARPPFQVDNPKKLLDLVLNARPPRFSEVGRDVPPALEAVVQRALEKDPGRRFRNASDMRQALKAAVDPNRHTETDGVAKAGVDRTQPPPPPPPWWRRWVPAGAALVALAALVGVLLMLTGGGWPLLGLRQTTSTEASAPAARNDAASATSAPVTAAPETSAPVTAAPATSAPAVPVPTTSQATSRSGAIAPAATLVTAIDTKPGPPEPPPTAMRSQHTATVLHDGRVLLVGGKNGPTPLATGQLYDPASNAWTDTGPLATSRFAHSATLLSDGHVLVVGGQDSETHYLDTAEVYDPGTNAWSPAGTLATARAYHDAVLLTDGRVLVTGGHNATATGFLDSVEIYDPASNGWTAAATMASQRSNHTSTLLANGQVLVVGGFGTNSETTAEKYDPLTNTWSPAGSLAEGRLEHTANLLPNGQVLVVGGANSFTRGGFLASAERYDPGTNTWSVAAPLASARSGQTATSLPGGQVLVVGGLKESGNTAELYDPTANSWAPAIVSMQSRRFHTTSLIQPAEVLIVGGETSGSGQLAGVERHEIARQPRNLTLPVISQQDSGETGTVALTDIGNGQVHVALHLVGSQPGSSPQPAHIHDGTCADLQPNPRLTLPPVIDGSSETDLNVSLQELLASPHAVHAHRSDQEFSVYMACADIPSADQIARQPQRVTLPVISQQNSGETGTATLTDTGDGKVHILVQLVGTQPGSSPQPAHIHDGTCANLQPNPRLTLPPVIDGTSETDLDVSLQELLATPHAIHVHRSDQEFSVYTACADVPTVQ